MNNMKITIDGKEYNIKKEISDLIILISKERDTYKDALRRLSKLGNGDIKGSSHGNIIAQDALDNFTAH